MFSPNNSFAVFPPETIKSSWGGEQVEAGLHPQLVSASGSTLGFGNYSAGDVGLFGGSESLSPSLFFIFCFVSSSAVTSPTPTSWTTSRLWSTEQPAPRRPDPRHQHRPPALAEPVKAATVSPLGQSSVVPGHAGHVLALCLHPLAKTRHFNHFFAK